MIKQRFQKLLRKSERGQAIILVAFAIIGLVAMVGLVTDTGILLIEYGKLKRGVDAAAVAAAQQYRASVTTQDLENAARNFLQLNQSTDLTSVAIHSCKFGDPAPPALCNPDPINQPNDNRKLVEVVASKTVTFGFLRVIGIETTTVTASATGEAATIDLVLVIDTSGSMAYETVPGGLANAPGNDPSVCNLNNTCQPMKVVKDTALDFLETLYISNDPYNSYDRVAIVAMTHADDRNPYSVLALTSNKAAIVSAINGIRVFEPRDCDGTETPGACLQYNDITGIFEGEQCEIYEIRRNSSDNNIKASADPSSCPSSNIGGALGLASQAFIADPVHTRLDAFWVVVSLLGGPANATDSSALYPYGFCPPNTFLAPMQLPWCRDRHPTIRHSAGDSLVTYINPETGVQDPHSPISLYDADDYARDMADGLATSTSGEGVTIFTIGLGEAVKYTGSSDDYYPDGITKIPAAEDLLGYIAECAGDDCGTTINHGQYFYAPTSTALADIFDRIAQNIATKISQ